MEGICWLKLFALMSLPSGHSRNYFYAPIPTGQLPQMPNQDLEGRAERTFNCSADKADTYECWKTGSTNTLEQ